MLISTTISIFNKRVKVSIQISALSEKSFHFSLPFVAAMVKHLRFYVALQDVCVRMTRDNIILDGCSG